MVDCSNLDILIEAANSKKKAGVYIIPHISGSGILVPDLKKTTVKKYQIETKFSHKSVAL